MDKGLTRLAPFLLEAAGADLGGDQVDYRNDEASEGSGPDYKAFFHISPRFQGGGGVRWHRLFRLSLARLNAKIDQTTDGLGAAWWVWLKASPFIELGKWISLQTDPDERSCFGRALFS